MPPSPTTPAAGTVPLPPDAPSSSPSGSAAASAKSAGSAASSVSVRASASSASASARPDETAGQTQIWLILLFVGLTVLVVGAALFEWSRRHRSKKRALQQEFERELKAISLPMSDQASWPVAGAHAVAGAPPRPASLAQAEPAGDLEAGFVAEQSRFSTSTAGSKRRSTAKPRLSIFHRRKPSTAASPRVTMPAGHSSRTLQRQGVSVVRKSSLAKSGAGRVAGRPDPTPVQRPAPMLDRRMASTLRAPSQVGASSSGGESHDGGEVDLDELGPEEPQRRPNFI